ncbi:MAG: hypothetical protein V1726_06565 [Methanobacteriota archaeon]
MTRGDNADVLKHVLKSFVNIISTKTSSSHAWLTVKVLVKKLSEEHNFLKNVDIVDKKFIAGYQPGYQPLDNDPFIIDFLLEIDEVNPKEIGRAIQSLADILKKNLGEKAGYYFLREFQDNLGEYYCSLIRAMGVDFRLVDLQNDVYGLEPSNYTIKEDGKTNIAFIKKIEDNARL